MGTAMIGLVNQLCWGLSQDTSMAPTFLIHKVVETKWKCGKEVRVTKNMRSGRSDAGAPRAKILLTPKEVDTLRINIMPNNVWYDHTFKSLGYLHRVSAGEIVKAIQGRGEYADLPGCQINPVRLEPLIQRARPVVVDAVKKTQPSEVGEEDDMPGKGQKVTNRKSPVYITHDQAVKIWEDYHYGRKDTVQLGEEYGVVPSTISDIVRGTNNKWGYLPQFMEARMEAMKAQSAQAKTAQAQEVTQPPSAPSAPSAPAPNGQGGVGAPKEQMQGQNVKERLDHLAANTPVTISNMRWIWGVDKYNSQQAHIWRAYPEQKIVKSGCGAFTVQQHEIGRLVRGDMNRQVCPRCKMMMQGFEQAQKQKQRDPHDHFGGTIADHPHGVPDQDVVRVEQPQAIVPPIAPTAMSQAMEKAGIVEVASNSRELYDQLRGGNSTRRPQRALQETMEFIMARMPKDGSEVDGAAVTQDAIRDGFSLASVQKAKTELGIEHRFVGNPNIRGGSAQPTIRKSMWRLPKEKGVVPVPQHPTSFFDSTPQPKQATPDLSGHPLPVLTIPPTGTLPEVPKPVTPVTTKEPANPVVSAMIDAVIKAAGGNLSEYGLVSVTELQGLRTLVREVNESMELVHDAVDALDTFLKERGA